MNAKNRIIAWAIALAALAAAAALLAANPWGGDGSPQIGYVSANVTYSVRSNTITTKVGFIHNGFITAKNTGTAGFDWCDLMLGYVSGDSPDVFAGRYEDDGGTSVAPGRTVMMPVKRLADDGRILLDRDRFDKGAIVCGWGGGIAGINTASTGTFTFKPVLLE
jgi:hypothetical protein